MIDYLQARVCFKVRIAYLFQGMLIAKSNSAKAYPSLALLQIYMPIFDLSVELHNEKPPIKYVYGSK